MYEYVYAHSSFYISGFSTDCCRVCSYSYTHPALRLMSCMWMKLKGSALFQTYPECLLNLQKFFFYFQWIWRILNCFLCLDIPFRMLIAYIFAICCMFIVCTKNSHNACDGCSLIDFFIVVPCFFRRHCWMENHKAIFIPGECDGNNKARSKQHKKVSI